MVLSKLGLSGRRLAASARCNPFVARPTVRSFSSVEPAAATATDQEDFVKTAVARVLQQIHHHDIEEKNGVSPQELDRSLQYFQAQLHEARLCIQDCHECSTPDHRAEELGTANRALEQAQLALVDWLDQVRTLPMEHEGSLKEAREASAAGIRELRHELQLLQRTLDV